MYDTCIPSYPMNAKYHMRLDGVDVGPKTYMKDMALFTPEAAAYIHVVRKEEEKMRAYLGI